MNMLLKLKKVSLIIVASLLMTAVLGSPVSLAVPPPAAPGSSTSPQTTATSPQSAATSTAQNDIQCGINEATGADCSAASNPSGDFSSTIKKILNLLSAVAGVLAVIMIMVAGVRLVVSAGNEEGVKKAKSSLVYAVIGVVIVAIAQIIVHFVISNVA